MDFRDDQRTDGLAMKRFTAYLASVLLVAGTISGISTPVYAQITATVVSACGTPPSTYHAGQPKPVTQDTTGKLCDSGGSSGGGVAGLTAEATATAVAAGTNKPQSEDTANGAARVELCDAGTTNCILVSAPSKITGNDGSTLQSPSNPISVLPNSQLDTVMLGGINVKEINGVAPSMGNGVSGTGVQRVTLASDSTGQTAITQTTPGTTNAVAVKDVNNVAPDFTLTSPTGQIGPYPGKNTAGVFSSATPETCSSGNVANATVACTLATASAKTTYISGFAMTADGATVGLAVSCTLTGTITGTMTFTFAYPAGALVAGVPLIVQFSPAVPASTTNTTIVASCPASGTGGTNASMNAWGYLL